MWYDMKRIKEICLRFRRILVPIKLLSYWSVSGKNLFLVTNKYKAVRRRTAKDSMQESVFSIPFPFCSIFLGKSCSEIKYCSPQATSGSYIIEPDEERSHGPFTVFLWTWTDKNGVGVTVISHDSEARMHVKGYEASGSYVRNVRYIATGPTNLLQFAFPTGVSTLCEQFIQYECRGSKLLATMGAKCQELKQKWLTGAEPHQLITRNAHAEFTSLNSCADPSRGCNCDKNDLKLPEESDLLREKSHLPVIQLRFGDTGSCSEEGYHTLGPELRCYDIKWREIAMEHNRTEQSRSLYSFKARDSNNGPSTETQGELTLLLSESK